MNITSEQLAFLMSSWMWPFIRIGAMLSISPLFGARYVPARIKLGLALVLTSVIVPVIEVPQNINAFSSAGILITFQQVFIGLALGFVLKLVWGIFEIAGQVISQPMGLHFASMVDPTSGIQVPVVSQFYLIMGSLIFLVLNGHLVFIHALAESFYILPVSTEGINNNALWFLISQMSWVFATAVLIGLPAITSLLVVNFSFAVMARAAPQLNIFAVGFPISLSIGFIVMLLTLPVILHGFEDMFDIGLQMIPLIAKGVF